MNRVQPKRTGLSCPQCKGNYGVIDQEHPRVIVLRCAGCEFRWFVAEPEDTEKTH